LPPRVPDAEFSGIFRITFSIGRGWDSTNRDLVRLHRYSLWYIAHH
jgi:hypothetical protein